MSEFMDAALEYAARGWRVFPLIPGMKEPATDNGFKDATSDVGQIESWWKLNPRYNIGIATGSGLCVIDVDDKPEKHGGLLGSDFLRDWEIEHGDISETCCVKTPTGGMHYYFDVGDTEIDSCQSDTIFIDIRCDKGYIVAPPSIHPDTGTAYEWDISPEEMIPARVTQIDRDCIDWIYANRKGADKDGNTDTSLPDEPIHEGNGRNNFLFSQGRSQRAKGASDELVADWLTILNKKYCLPPLPDSELWKTIGSVCSVAPGLSKEAKKRAGSGGRKFSHSKIARTLMEKNGVCFVDGMPAIRNGNRYEIGWNAVAREIVKLDDDATRQNQKEVQHYLMVMGEQKSQSSPDLIAFNNGVLDTTTYELRDWRDDDVIPNIIPHDWDENAKCPEVDAVLWKMACGKEDVYWSLIETMGMCMFRSSEYTQSAILLGRGSNGKSTFIRMLQALLGIENISSLDMAMLGKQFHTGRLAGKLANLGDDISNEFKRGDLLSVYKKVVDGNRIYADVKGVEGFEFNPYCTLVFSANEFPKLDDYTDGMLRRIFPIEFNAKFSKSDPDYDPRIAAKVTSEKACQRMCVLGVLGLERLRKSNGFTPNEASKRKVDEIQADNDTVLAWIIDAGYTAETIAGNIIQFMYEDYSAWAAAAGSHPVGRTKFTRGVNNHLGTKSEVAWVDGRSVKTFKIADGSAS